MQQLHITDIIDVYLLFQNDHESPSIELYRENRCRKVELAYCRLPLYMSENGRRE
jgi:hypothetical protein